MDSRLAPRIQKKDSRLFQLRRQFKQRIISTSERTFGTEE